MEKKFKVGDRVFFKNRATGVVAIIKGDNYFVDIDDRPTTTWQKADELSLIDDVQCVMHRSKESFLTGNLIFECSACGAEVSKPDNYCPHCGREIIARGGKR